MTFIRDIATDLWADRKCYEEYRTVVLANSLLRKGSSFFGLVDRMYLSHILTGIRSLDDTDPRSISFYNLIEEVRDHPETLTRTWFINRLRDRSIGEYQFAEHWNGRRHISKRRVSADLKSLVSLCRRIRIEVNKRIAHHSRRKPRTPLAYKDIDRAIDGIFELVNRYTGLLLNRAWAEPSLLSSRKIYEIPWMQ